ncbi:urea ABC transporter permease subunit UrtB [Oceaniserpentilla sp. 4NH20-0058]|uniref:urea ABC transporter permease subunit UrtB n=1 Tax=Oceaniserpentilla sp. 4NH20-0058 TaxID=3127660 RepID=UPI0031086713
MNLLKALLVCTIALGSVMSANASTGECQSHLASIEQSNDLQSSKKLTFEQLVCKLVDANYDEKSDLIESLANSQHDQSLSIIKSLQSADLFYVKKTGDVVFKKKLENGRYQANSVFTNEILGEFKKRKLKKVGINNNLRRTINGVIAELQISSSDVKQREAAALELLKAAEISALPLLEKAITKEQDEYVGEILATARALVLLQSDDSLARIDAIKYLKGSLYVETRNGLNAFLNRAKQAGNTYNKSEIAEAEKSLEAINELVRLNGLLENVYFGVALGAVLLLAAIGLAITFGVMGVINMAHGEMIMLGAYTTFVIQQLMPDNIGMSLVVAVPAAFLVSGLVGVLIERSVIRHLYGRPLETLLATFGISLILQQAVRSIFGPLNQDVQTPEWMAGTFTVNAGLELTFNRLYIIIFSLLVLAALAVVLKKTLFGLQMRAVTMNRPMASSMGIKTGWVDALTFGLGSGIAGIAGVALSQLTNVGPNLGQQYIIDSFMVVVFGGVGNLWGTLVGAMSLGVANKIFEPMAGAVLAKIIVLVAIILFIQKRPRGLFALKGRSVED